jgi:hypothetical protein
MNIVLITSVINICSNRLSYTNTRSVYTSDERFEQTKLTLASVKKYIPCSKILFVECSNISSDIESYLKENTDYYINLVDNNNILKQTQSVSKSMGEGILTINGIKFLIDNDIKFNNLIKISGRYYLNDIFNYTLWDNDNIVKKQINIKTNVITAFYKLPYKYIISWYNYLLNSTKDFIKCKGYEIIFGEFLMSLNCEAVDISIIGCQGNVSVCGTLISF